MKKEADKIIEFTLLYNRYKKRLYNFLLRLSSDSMVAEDIVQSVFIKLYENYDVLKNKESANYWLFKSARNEYYNYFRRNKKSIGIDEVIKDFRKDNFELEAYVELKEFKEIIFFELNKMPDEQREVYLLKEYGGMSYKEISETLEIDEKLVKSRLYKVRQKLIDKISKLV